MEIVGKENKKAEQQNGRKSRMVVSCTLSPASYLLHPISCTLSPAPYLLHPISCILSPAPYLLLPLSQPYQAPYRLRLRHHIRFLVPDPGLNHINKVMTLGMQLPLADTNITVINAATIDQPVGTMIPHRHFRSDADAKFAGPFFIVIFQQWEGQTIFDRKGIHPCTGRNGIWEIPGKTYFLQPVGFIKPGQLRGVKLADGALIGKENIHRKTVTYRLIFQHPTSVQRSDVD